MYYSEKLIYYQLSVYWKNEIRTETAIWKSETVTLKNPKAKTEPTKKPKTITDLKTETDPTL